MTRILPRNPNVFANSPLDRASHRRADKEWLSAAFADKRSLFMPVWKLMPFLVKGREGKHEAGWITSELALALMRPGSTTIFLGVQNDTAHFAIDVSGMPDIPTGARPTGISNRCPSEVTDRSSSDISRITRWRSAMASMSLTLRPSVTSA